MIAGPNGAGKTSFYETALKPRIVAPFINADIIQRDELQDKSVEASYEAARIAAKRRDECLDEGVSFVTETVFSHPSKLEFLHEARARGFRIVVFHLHVASADLVVARVAERVKEGGHPVPEDKIRERYLRNQAIIRSAILMSDRGRVYDSSRLNQAPRLLCSARDGRLERLADALPDWFVSLYGKS